MQNRFIGAILVAALMPATWAQAGAAKQAAPAKQTAKVVRPATIMGKPNFNGIWFAQGTALWNLEAHSAEDMGDRFFRLGAMAAIPAGKSYLKGGGSIPYTPAGLAKRNENKKNAPEYDPEAKCYMLGVPRVTYSGMPFQIIQGTGGSGNLEGDMIMVYPFDATNRVINMKDHSEAPIDSWMGKSDGTWQGNTLVVETKFQYDKTWLDRAGNHHSADMKVTERFNLIDKDHMHYEATIDDPKTFTRPWTIEMPLYRMIDENAQILEHKCVPFADKLLYHDLIHPGEPKIGQ